MGQSRLGRWKGGFSWSGPLVKCMILSFLGWMLKPMSMRAFSRTGKVFWSLVVLMEREEDKVRRMPLSTYARVEIPCSISSLIVRRGAL